MVALILFFVAIFVWPFCWTSQGPRLFGKPRARGTPLEESERGLVGHWEWRAGMGHSTLELSPDGTFVGTHGGCFGSEQWQGIWRRRGDRLLLSSISIDSPGPRLWRAFDRTDEYQVVPWANRILLVPADDMDGFVEDVNRGRERGRGEGMRYSRDCRPAPTLKGLPDLPEPWKSRLVPEIRGKLLEVTARSVRAGVGARDGVKVGSILYVGGGPKTWPVQMRVLTVTETECSLEITANQDQLPVTSGAGICSQPYDIGEDGCIVDR